MKASLLKIQNILGVECAEIQLKPTGVTLVHGGNGTGKSSIVEALKSLFEGGYDATLIRNGADRGEVVLVLDDQTTIRKAQVRGRKQSDVQVRPAGGLPPKRPAEFISALVDGYAADPVKFIMAKPSERVRLLLEAMPISVTAEQLQAAGITAPVDVTGHGLEVIEALRAEIFEERTGVNRSAKDKRSHAAELTRALPTESLDEEQRRFGEASEQLAAIDKALADRKADIKQKLEAEKKRRAEERDGIVADIDRQIAELQTKRQAEIKACDDWAALVTADANRIYTEAVEKSSAERARLSGIVAASGGLVAALERAEGTRAAAQKADEEAALLEQHSALLTAQIEALDKLKGQLASSLPIPGVEIRIDGKAPALYVDGIPFDRLNKAKQVQVALRVARLRVGELPLVIMDNAECLDAETFAAFQAAAEGTGLQFLVTRVTSGPLTIEGAVAAAVPE